MDRNCYFKKLVTKLPNFPDRMIRYGSFFLNISSKKNLQFFKGEGRGRSSFFIILRYLKQLFHSKPCAILYLFKDGVADPTPFNKFSQNIIKIKKVFGNFLIFGD